MSSWDMNDFFKATKKNGLSNYDVDAIGSKRIQTANVYESGVGGNKYIEHSMKTVQNSFIKNVDVVNGNIMLLQWGKNIPLSNSLTSSVGGLNSTLDIVLTAKCANPDAKLCNLYMVHFYERELVFDKDGMTHAYNHLFSQNDYVTAMNMWQSKVQSGRLYVNTASLRGGSFFSSAVDKVSSVLPKILPAIKQGIKFYNNNKDSINGAVSGVANGDMDQIRQSLANLLKSS
jgi:hypothetical protein